MTSGHPLLMAAATEAVSQWQYKPTLVDGKAVEVVTEVEVVFSLKADATKEDVKEPRVRLLSPPREELTNYVEPEYPLELLVNGTRGTLRMEVTLGEDGKVVGVSHKSGPHEFMEESTKAVQQWVFAANEAREKDKPLVVALVFEAPAPDAVRKMIAESATAAFEKDPSNPEPLYRLALVAKAKKEYVVSATLLRRVLSMDGSHKARHDLIGLLQQNLHDPEALVSELRTASNLSPDRGYLRAELAQVLLKLNDLDGAIAELEILVRSGEEGNNGCSELAIALYRKKGPAAATDVERLAGQCSDGASNFHTMLGMALMSKGRFRLAQAHYEAALRASPNQPDVVAQMSQIRVMREGAACVQQKISAEMREKNRIGAMVTMAWTEYILTEDVGRALAKLRAVAGNEDVPAPIYAAVGYVLSELGGWDMAIAELQKIVAARPNANGARVALASVLLQRGRIDEALAHARTVLAENPKDPAAGILAASALLAQGKVDETEGSPVHADDGHAIAVDRADVDRSAGRLRHRSAACPPPLREVAGVE